MESDLSLRWKHLAVPVESIKRNRRVVHDVLQLANKVKRHHTKPADVVLVIPVLVEILWVLSLNMLCELAERRLLRFSNLLRREPVVNQLLVEVLVFLRALGLLHKLVHVARQVALVRVAHDRKAEPARVAQNLIHSFRRKLAQVRQPVDVLVIRDVQQPIIVEPFVLPDQHFPIAVPSLGHWAVQHLVLLAHNDPLCKLLLHDFRARRDVCRDERSPLQLFHQAFFRASEQRLS
mmetsp:Transcript_1125/g.2224  ORF Transcript_1125/g.2224 Transcript_1125/m.2224 type:complete len:235 (-) Transcript_1125:1133-1837(-)